MYTAVFPEERETGPEVYNTITLKSDCVTIHRNKIFIVIYY